METVLSNIAGPETADSVVDVSRRFGDELPRRLAHLELSSGCRALTIIVAFEAGSGGHEVRRTYRRKDERQVITRHASPYEWLDASGRDRIALYGQALIDAVLAADPKRISQPEQRRIIDAIVETREALAPDP